MNMFTKELSSTEDMVRESTEDMIRKSTEGMSTEKIIHSFDQANKGEKAPSTSTEKFITPAVAPATLERKGV